MELQITKIWNKTWKDRHGRVVIWQNPNVFLLAWLVLTIISLLISGNAANVFQYLGIAALVIWSLLELIKGVNYFRRALGLVVLVLSVMSIIHIA